MKTFNDAKLVIRIGLQPQIVCLESKVPDGAVIVSQKDSDVALIETWGHRGHVCHDGSHKIFSPKD